MKNIAVFFPGIGYTVDKPLMYYSRKLATSLGYEIKLLPYEGFPEKVIGNKDKMYASYDIAMSQAREMIKDIDFSQYDNIVFIGKSIGTIVSTTIALDYNISDKVRFILYTPLEQTFKRPAKNAIAFSGTADPWLGNENTKIPSICDELNVILHMYDNANHSLETGDITTDLNILQDVMSKTKEHLSHI